MRKPLRATLRGKHWKDFYKSIQFCYSCGKKLVRRYVKEEKRKRHVCATCKKITYINPKIAAGVIPIWPDGRILLLRRSIEPGYGKWTYPAGFQEIGETVQEAAVREAYEEAGIRATLKDLLGIYSYRDSAVVSMTYVGTVPKSEKPRVSAEALEVKLFYLKDIPWKNLAFRSIVDALTDIKKY